MGGLWQAFAFGFAGLRPIGDVLRVDPRHPPRWKALEMRVRFRGSRVRVRTEELALTIHADPGATVLVGSGQYDVGPNGLRFALRESNWEVIT